MDRNFVRYLRSLPQKVSSLREQAAALTAEANAIEVTLECLDRSRLNHLKLTGSPKLDAALRLSMGDDGSYYDGSYVLRHFPTILEKIEMMEKAVSNWREGTLMLVDFTSQMANPLLLSLIILELPPTPSLQILPTSGYFSTMPVSVQVTGQLLLSWSSNGHALDCVPNRMHLIGTEYEFTNNYSRLKALPSEQKDRPVAAATFDLSQLLDPNWGTKNVDLAGITLGEHAIADHIEEWKKYVDGRYMDSIEKEQYLKFLNEFLETVQGLYKATV